jgi:hypothetical protein
MFVKIAVTISVLLDFETQAKSPHRLTSEVGYGSGRTKQDRMARFPHSKTQIHFFVVIKKLFIEALKFPQKVVPQHEATTREPIHLPLCVSVPTNIDVRKKSIRNVPEWAQIKCSQPSPPDGRKGTRRDLEGTVRVDDTASHGTGLRVPLSELHEAVKRVFMYDGVGV